MDDVMFSTGTADLSRAERVLARYGLNGKRGLIVGIANDKSIAYYCAKAATELGAKVLVTYESEKARRFVQPCADAIGAVETMPCDVTNAAQVSAVFSRITELWGGMDFLLHAVAWAPQADLHGAVYESSKDGFLRAMDISAHSFARMGRLAAMLMHDGGSLITLTYEGAVRIKDPHYSIMGPAKAALEAEVRAMAYELGGLDIRVNAISPGPMLTRAGGGLKDFDLMMEDAIARSPLGRLADKECVAAEFTHLVGNGGRDISGQVRYVDSGYSIV